MNYSISPAEPALPSERALPTNRFVPFAKEATEQSIPARIEEQVRRYPERTALKTGRHELSYDALNQAANRVARALLAQRGERAEPIALLLDHEAPLLIALLGVLKAGKFYVPLDPSYPRARTRSMLVDSQAGLLITDGQRLPLAAELARGECSLLNLDEIDPGSLGDNPNLAIAPDAFSYLLYTSGSTGQPKGVVENHRNVLHFTMNNTNVCRFSANDRLALFASCAFSAAATPIYGALLNGATLCPLDLKTEGLAPLADWLVQEKITVFHGGTSFGQFVRTLTGGEQFPRLRLIYWGGEPLRRQDVELYRKHFSRDCILVNSLGATEMKCFRLYLIDHETPINGGIVPVGYPVEDVEVLLLDEAGRPVGGGEIGEMAIKTRYLAPAYWRRPDLTQEKFRPDPEGGSERIYQTGDLGRMLPDGCLLHLGRKDAQVKIRGMRVEVAEIEGALLEIPRIEEAVVVRREDRAGEPRLVAYVAPKPRVPSGSAPAASALRRALAETLPAAMIPSAFVILEALPRNPNGKVDRAALPAPPQGTPGVRPDLETPFVPPRTPLEARLAAIWTEVLDVTPIGIHDRFLELGGDSLRAAQVIARIRSTLQVELPLRQLFVGPTVARLANAIFRVQAREHDPQAMAQLLVHLEQMSDEEAGRELAEAAHFGQGGIGTEVTI